VDARVEFEDAPGCWKWRPVVVLSTSAEGFVVTPCTTVPRPGPRQLALRDWQFAGLVRPTDVVLRTRSISRSDLGTVRGHLSGRDEERLISVLKVVDNRCANPTVSDVAQTSTETSTGRVEIR
jgi:hypothetical protein